MLGQAADAAAEAASAMSPVDVFHGYILVFVFAFLTTVCATPILRRLAIANGIVDRPSEARKLHRIPIAYLGGVAVFLGLLAGVVASFIGPELAAYDLYQTHIPDEDTVPFPLSILLGMTVITITGLWDDVFGLDPRLKVAGQLLAAAALAMDDVGVKVAQGVLAPVGELIGNPSLIYEVPCPPLPSGVIEVDIVYWCGTAIIAVFVLGACNASNLIDGLDGLLSGVTAIAAGGLAVIACLMAAAGDGAGVPMENLDGSRVILCLALLGACLGFLPHNFNPATIFLGDCGSLLMGYVTIVIILTLGNTGKTHYVIAGLVIYSIPIIDTVLAIVRRKLAGRPMSAADDQHLHHMLKRAVGVKGAALILYGMGLVFAALGVWLTFGRVRLVFTIALVVAAFIGVTAVKIARREALEAHALGPARPTPTPPTAPGGPAAQGPAGPEPSTQG